LPTTADVSSGIVAAIRQVLKDSKADPKSMTGVMIGTTHFTNSVR
jgi:N-methylhydantoinase A/oxoprolinase/acetone carboxylase beta subunit